MLFSLLVGLSSVRVGVSVFWNAFFAAGWSFVLGLLSSPRGWSFRLLECFLRRGLEFSSWDCFLRRGLEFPSFGLFSSPRVGDFCLCCFLFVGACVLFFFNVFLNCGWRFVFQSFFIPIG